MSEELVRPVKCHLCNRPMFYRGDKRFEPEVRVSVDAAGGFEDRPECFHAHVRCWNRTMGNELAQAARPLLDLLAGMRADIKTINLRPTPDGFELFGTAGPGLTVKYLEHVEICRQIKDLLPPENADAKEEPAKV